MLALFTLSSPVLALTQDDIDSILGGTAYYDPTSTVCGNNSPDIQVVNSLPSTVPEPYSSLLAQAAAVYKANVQLMAAIFMSENGNT
ncbi:MAG TPA: hypothetical protein VHA30_00195, partial [Patescibacteria group bacterium]|nr:hypothetical protein [Patescibacteria group bacterium]